ncbi:MAG TPA: DUF1360 domain-containing protein [Gaiellaceae bacterium]|nr:DUF1360 domain-containing protein [Gaiellaceae bacterium]
MTPTTVRDPPYGGYAAIAGSFAGGVALLAIAARRRDLSPYTPFDFTVLALATFKAARTLARDNVGSFIREPFVEGTPSEPNEEHPVATGDIRQAVGELVTCTRCVGTWAAVGMTATEVLAPSFGRILIRSLALGGANDWLQAGFAALASAGNRERASSVPFPAIAGTRQ